MRDTVLSPPVLRGLRYGGREGTKYSGLLRRGLFSLKRTPKNPKRWDRTLLSVWGPSKYKVTYA